MRFLLSFEFRINDGPAQPRLPPTVCVSVSAVSRQSVLCGILQVREPSKYNLRVFGRIQNILGISVLLEEARKNISWIGEN
jgi:hypothetical protein